MCLYPARLLCPWDFPGKNTGVNIYSLLQGIFHPDPGTEHSSPALQADSLPSEPPGKSLIILYIKLINAGKKSKMHTNNKFQETTKKEKMSKLYMLMAYVHWQRNNF